MTLSRGPRLNPTAVPREPLPAPSASSREPLPPLECPRTCVLPACADIYTPPGSCCPICRLPGEERSGQCPNPWMFATCVFNMCSTDFDCPAPQKCCRNICSGRVCRLPAQPQVEQIVCEKNGHTYINGESVPDNDPCKRCSCRRGLIMCAMMSCAACDGPRLPGQCCRSCLPQPVAMAYYWGQLSGCRIT
ncbi:kielin/chordin-like protein [Dreissena polymorpha]|uniref:kielin/chordin-like protein n=1 Tax=Dreissena polymorpha TaxID=45954 RepID=UPI0022648CCA|nr:kielin/chordin-like protein [Dreissena polymorpha]